MDSTHLTKLPSEEVEVTDLSKEKKVIYDKCCFVTRTEVLTYALDWKIEHFTLVANVLGRNGNLVSPIFPSEATGSSGSMSNGYMSDEEEAKVKLQVSLTYKQLEKPSRYVLGAKVLRVDEQQDEVYDAEVRLCFVNGRKKEVGEQYCYFIAGMQNYTELELPRNMSELLSGGQLTLRCEVMLAKQKSQVHEHVPELHQYIKHQDEIENASTPSIFKGLSLLDKQEKLFDIELLIGGQSFKAHKVVLAAWSSKFANLFLEKPNTPQLEVQGLSPSSFKIMKKFMYSHELDKFESLDQASDLLVEVEEFGIEELKRRCEDYLCKKLRVENSFEILSLADRCNCEDFKDSIIRFISREFKRSVLSSEDYKHLKRTNPQLAVQLLEQLNNAEE